MGVDSGQYELELPEPYRSPDFGSTTTIALYNIRLWAGLYLDNAPESDIARAMNALLELQREWGYVVNDEMWRPVPDPDFLPELVFTASQLVSFPSELYFRREEPEVLTHFGGIAPDWRVCLSLLSRIYFRLSERFRERASQGGRKVDRAALIRSAQSMIALSCEAIFFARLVDGGALIESEVRRAVSERNTRAAQARHSRVNAIKKRFVDFYDGVRLGSSVANAARKFRETLSRDELRLFSESNFVRTMRDAVRSARKARGH